MATMASEVDLIQSGGALDFQYGAYKEFAFEPVKVGQVLHDGDTIELGGVVVTALHTPGHTKGTTTFTMNVADDGKTYRVVFLDGTSINPGYRLTKAPSYPGIADDYARTFRVLESLNPDIWLCAHPEMFDFESKRAKGKGPAAFVDPEGYRRFIAGGREKLEALLAREHEMDSLTTGAGDAVHDHRELP
jgi:metallo-beta-lactamase class B